MRRVQDFNARNVGANKHLSDTAALHFGVKGQCRIQVCGCIAISLVWVLFGVG